MSSSDPNLHLTAPNAGKTAAAPSPGGPDAERNEAIIHSTHPALLVEGEKIKFRGHSKAVQALEKSRLLVEPKVASVGRIDAELGDKIGYGTGFHVGNGYIVTNSHVAEFFADPQGEGSFRIKDGAIVSIFFGADPDSETIGFTVDEVLYMRNSPVGGEPDIAILKVKESGSLPPALILAETPVNTTEIAVLGYPLDDSDDTEETKEKRAEELETVFLDGQLGMKRVSPGYADPERHMNDWSFYHNASTLNGSSGSPVLDMRTGFVIGVHYSGEFHKANYAVKSNVVKKRLNSFQLSLREGASFALSRAPLPAYMLRAAPESASISLEMASKASVQDLKNRQGYDPDFLGITVPLPIVKEDNRFGSILNVDGTEDNILRYSHFSVQMNKDRRLCFFSASNVDGSQSVSLKRKSIPWTFDPRIPEKYQILNECYGSENQGKYSHGHMTRRQDPVWGSEEEARNANRDTFFVTNAVPQKQKHNSPIWLGLEDYVLDHAREDRMKISVFTGPVFTNSDPERFGVKIPVSFWKVIAFIHDDTNELAAAGYISTQAEYIDEFVYGSYSDFQVKISEIERLTDISFGDLSKVDVLTHYKEDENKVYPNYILLEAADSIRL